MGQDFAPTGDGTKIATWARVDGSNNVEVPEGIADFLNGTTPTPVSNTVGFPTNLIQVGGAGFNLGQQLASASLPVVLTAAQVAALTPPSTVAVSNFPSSFAVSNFPSTQPISAASLPLPTGAATETTLAALNAKVTAVNTGATVISSALPVGSNVIGGVTIADGSNVTVGAKADAAASTDTGTFSLMGLIKRGLQSLTSILAACQAATPAGTNVIGKVTIDQTTPGTTNLVQVGGSLPAGSNAIGTVTSKIADTSGNGITSGSLNAGVVRAIDVIVRDSTGAQVSSFGGNAVNISQINGNTILTGGVSGSVGVGGIGASGSAVSGNPVLIGGSDGTNARTFLADTAGRSIVTLNGPATITATLSALNNAATFTGQLGIVGVLVAATVSGNTLSMLAEASPDGSTWYTAQGVSLGGWNNQAAGTVVTAAVNGPASTMCQMWVPVPPGWQFRFRCSAFTSGSASVYLMPMQVPPSGINYGQTTIASSQFLSLTAATVGAGYSIARTPSGGSAATTNATNLKTSAARIHYIHVTNTVVSVRYLKIYNKASAPTVGTDTPTATYAIPASYSGVLYMGSDIGMAVSSGLGYALTAAAADSDTTAVGAGDIFLVIAYL